MSKVYFVTIGEPGYSRSWTYFNQLKSIKKDVEFVKITPPKIFQEIYKLRKFIPRNAQIVVMSPSQYLVIPIRIIISKNIIMDAGWSLFEGTVISRKIYGCFFYKVIKTYLIDLSSSYLAKKVLVESELQLKYFKKMFRIREEKLEVLYTGVDEKAFDKQTKLIFVKDIFANNKIVLFRGKFNPEAGLEVLAETSRILEAEPITFWISSPGVPDNIVFSKNCLIEKKLISKPEISFLLKNCTLSLGQLANHKRLSRTIPHKAFESAYMSSPYITARSKGILEIFTEGWDVICFDPGNPRDLADKILETIFDKNRLHFISSNMKSTYEKNFSQNLLANKVNEILSKL